MSSYQEATMVNNGILRVTGRVCLLTKQFLVTTSIIPVSSSCPIRQRPPFSSVATAPECFLRRHRLQRNGFCRPRLEKHPRNYTRYRHECRRSCRRQPLPACGREWPDRGYLRRCILPSARCSKYSRLPRLHQKNPSKTASSSSIRIRT